MNDETQISPATPSVLADAPASDADTATMSRAALPAETLDQTLDQAGRSSIVGTLPGRVVVPGYDIIGELGRGGMGVVYKARHLKLNRIVALKMVLGAQHADPRELARFVAEAQAVAEIKHPNVIQVFDSGEVDGHPFMAMECLEGGSLSQHLRQVGTMPPAAASALLVEIARGVRAAHDRGIVHRDLKPHNVMLDATTGAPGSLGTPKVMDFGLAKRGGADLTQTGAVMGTPAYMAPEQAKGETKSIGPAADVYALGVILYECLTGSVPFTGSDAWSVIRQVVSDEPEPVTRRLRGTPRELDLICRKCLSKQPDDRYATAAELADDLQRYINGEGIRGPRTGVWYTARRVTRRWSRPIGAACALVAIVLAAWLIPSPLHWLRDQKAPAENAITDAERERITNEVAGFLHDHPTPDRNSPHDLTQVAELPRIDYSRFRVRKDEQIADLRGWREANSSAGAAENAVVYLTNRDVKKIAATNDLRAETRTSPGRAVSRVLRPNDKNARAIVPATPGATAGQLVFDVSDIPVNQEFTLRYSTTLWGAHQTPADCWVEGIGHDGAVKTVVILFPSERPFRSYELRYAAPGNKFEPYTGSDITVAAEDKSWLYWTIPSPKVNHVYRIDWAW